MRYSPFSNFNAISGHPLRSNHHSQQLTFSVDKAQQQKYILTGCRNNTSEHIHRLTPFTTVPTVRATFPIQKQPDHPIYNLCIQQCLFLPVDWALAGNCRTANLYGASRRGQQSNGYGLKPMEFAPKMREARGCLPLEWYHRRATHRPWAAGALHLFFPARTTPETTGIFHLDWQINIQLGNFHWRLRFLKGGSSLSFTTTTCQLVTSLDLRRVALQNIFPVGSLNGGLL